MVWEDEHCIISRGQISEEERRAEERGCTTATTVGPKPLPRRHKSKARWSRTWRSCGRLSYLVLSPCWVRVQTKENRPSLGEWALCSPCGTWADWWRNQNTNMFGYKEDAPCQTDQMFTLTGQRILSCWKIYTQSQIIIQRLSVSMKSEQREGMRWALWHP